MSFFWNHPPLSESDSSLNTISALEINTNSSALLLLIANVPCENQLKGVTSLGLCQGSKVELLVGMKPCLIRFYYYLATILAKACWVRQFLFQYAYCLVLS